MDTPHDVAKLLDGGRYVLSRRGPNLTCYDVHMKKSVWRYKGQWDSSAVVLDFEAEIGDDGHSMVIVICLCILSEPSNLCVSSSIFIHFSYQDANSSNILVS